VAALFVLSFTVSNAIASFGVFLPTLAEVFGWSRGAISLALSLNLLLGGVSGLGAGALADRHGPRPILLITIGVGAAGFVLASTMDSLWQLYLSIGVMGGVGGAGFYVIGAATVARWFDRGRGLALGIVLAAFSVSYLTGGPVAAGLIESVGWRIAYLVLGSLVLFVGGGATLLVHDPPGRADATSERSSPAGGRGVSMRAAFADPRLWYLTLSWVLSGVVSLMLSVHVVSYAHDRGISLASASLALTAYGLGSSLGRLVLGSLSDRLSARPLMHVCVGLQVGALVVLPWGPSQGVLLLILTLFGFGFTGADSVFVRIIPDVFGLQSLGAITGVLSLGFRFGAAVGPALAGFVHDATNSYTLPFGLAPVLVVLSYVSFARGARTHR